MAGWLAWDDLQLTVGTSMAQSVLPTIFPVIKHVAVEQGWENYTDNLLFGFASQILLAKKRQFPALEHNEDASDAILAGEMWAPIDLHQSVSRFDTPDLAINWLMRWRTNTALRLQQNEANILRERYHFNWIAENGDVAWDGRTFAQYVIIVYVMGGTTDAATFVVQGLVNYVCGISKMGNMTPGWIRSRLAQIRRESQVDDLELSKQVLIRVWDFYGAAYAPVGNWRRLFQYVKGACAAKRLLRLSITAMQSAEQGCTVINIIRDAQIKCPDFNWQRFKNPRTVPERAIAAELAIFDSEFAKMQADPWVRFGPDPGQAPKMANAGFLCKQLLLRAKGQNSLENYSGLEHGNLDVPHSVWIGRVVAKYIEQIAQQMAADDVDVLAGPGDEIWNPDVVGHVAALGAEPNPIGVVNVANWDFDALRRLTGERRNDAGQGGAGQPIVGAPAVNVEGAANNDDQA